MRLRELSLAGLGAVLIGLSLALALAVAAGLHIRGKQAELAELFVLRARLDDFSVASDSLLLYGADPGLMAAYRTEAAALQDELRRLGAEYPDAQKAAYHIGIIVESVAMTLEAGPSDGAPNSVGPLALSPRSRIVMSEVAGHGIALDTALDDVLRQRREAIQHAATLTGSGLGLVLLLFGVLLVVAFMLVRSRVAGPARDLGRTLERIRAGELDARAPVTGSDELAELAHTLNKVLEERQAADAVVAERQRQLEDSKAELEAVRDRLVRAQEVGHIGSWDVDLASGRLDWSDQVFTIFGIARADFAGTEEAFFELVHPEDRQWLREERARWLADGGELDAEHRIIRPDGEVRWVREQARTIAGPGGRPAFTTGTVQDVTVRRRLLDEVRQFLTLLENTEDLCAIVDADYRYLWVNRSYLDHYRRGYMEVVGRHLREILGDAFFTELVEPYLVRAFAGEAQRFEAEREYPGRGRRNLLVRYQPILSPDGAAPRVAVLITDITDVKRAEAALAEQARLLDMAGRAARFGAWAVDLTEGRVRWSGAVAEIHGMPRGYSPTLDEGIAFYAPEYRDRIRELFMACAEEGRPYDEELQIIDARGKRVWVRALGEAVRGGDGNIVRVEGAFQDVTPQREREAALRQLSQIVEQSPATIVVTGLDGRIEYVNRAFEAVTGYTRDEAIGATPALVQSGLTPDAAYRELWETITAGHVWKGELQNRRRDGTLYWESVVISPLTDEQGKTVKYVGIKEDVTEHRRVQEQLQQAQKMEAVGNLAGGIAHDFNNLLGVVLGNLQLANRHLDGGPDTDLEPVRKRLRTALEAINRGSELTRRLLSFSRNPVMEPRLVDLNELVGGMADMLARTLGENIDVRLKTGEAVWPASLDPGLTENMLLNLAVNARDAMPEGGTLVITTRNSRLDATYARLHEGVEPGEYVELAVSDTGVGMPPEVQRRVFEPFFSTKPPEKGSGLGLTMVYGIAQQSGGHVGLYSEEGTGTTVRVYFPRADGHVERAGGDGDAPAEPDGGEERVLVVEDDALLRETAVQGLRQLGYQVLEAGNGPEALALLEAEPQVDLLFTDVVMPGGITGAELARRATARSPGLRVLLTSGYARDVLDGQIINDLHTHLLYKPYTVEELARQVREALDGGREQQGIGNEE